MAREWSVRTCREEDKEGVLDLFRIVYPKSDYHQQHLTDWYRWKYEDNPAGTGVILVADHDGKIVGSDAKIPVLAKLGSETAIICQSVDSMTHPEHRRPKMWMTLHLTARQEVKKRGMDIVLGFPSEMVYRWKDRLGYFDVARMPLIVKPFNWGKALELRLKNRLLRRVGTIAGRLLQGLFYRAKRPPVVEGLTITRVTDFDNRMNDLWERVSSQHQISLVRNKVYLNWRYAVPGVDYIKYIAEKDGRVQGYVVSRCMPREQLQSGIIFDILAESEEIAQCLVAKAVEHCKQERVDLIYAGMIANKMYLRALRKNGFIYLPSVKLLPVVFSSTSQHISNEFLREPKNWLVQIGDSDVI